VKRYRCRVCTRELEVIDEHRRNVIVPMNIGDILAGKPHHRCEALRAKPDLSKLEEVK